MFKLVGKDKYGTKFEMVSDAMDELQEFLVYILRADGNGFIWRN